jgi:hypothetical protein
MFFSSSTGASSWELLLQTMDRRSVGDPVEGFADMLGRGLLALAKADGLVIVLLLWWKRNFQMS